MSRSCTRKSIVSKCTQGGGGGPATGGSTQAIHESPPFARPPHVIWHSRLEQVTTKHSAKELAMAKHRRQGQCDVPYDRMILRCEVAGMEGQRVHKCSTYREGSWRQSYRMLHVFYFCQMLPNAWNVFTCHFVTYTAVKAKGDLF